MTLATIRRAASRCTTASGSTPCDLEADEAGRQPRRRRRSEADAADLREPACSLRGERAHPRLDPPAADRVVEAERLGERPAVLEGVEAAGRQARAVGDPGGVAPAARRRSSRRRRRTGSSAGRARARGSFAPRDAGAARAVEPLVAAGGERVAAAARAAEPPGAEAVHAVDARGRAHGRVRGSASAIARIGSLTPVLECTQVNATTRVCGRDPAAQPRHDLVDRRHGAGRRTDGRAAPSRRRTEAQRLVRRVEVVLGRHDLLVRLQREPRVEQAEAHRRRVGERDLVRGTPRYRPAAERAAAVSRPSFPWRYETASRSSPATMTLDRVSHGPWMGGEQEGRQVDAPRIERELRAHAAPAAQVGLLPRRRVAVRARPRRRRPRRARRGLGARAHPSLRRPSRRCTIRLSSSARTSPIRS